MKPLAGLTLLFSMLIVAESRSDDTKNDLEKLQGTWTVVSFEVAGDKASEAEGKKAAVKWLIKGDNVTLQVAGRNVMEGTLKIDATKKPKSLDLKMTNPGGRVEEAVGIYELSGDSLKICYAPASDQRPTEFKTAAGTKQCFCGYKRDKP